MMFEIKKREILFFFFQLTSFFFFQHNIAHIFLLFSSPYLSHIKMVVSRLIIWLSLHSPTAKLSNADVALYLLFLHFSLLLPVAVWLSKASGLLPCLSLGTSILPPLPLSLPLPLFVVTSFRKLCKLSSFFQSLFLLLSLTNSLSFCFILLYCSGFFSSSSIPSNPLPLLVSIRLPFTIVHIFPPFFFLQFIRNSVVTVVCFICLFVHWLIN